MKSVELYARVRRSVVIDGLSRREAARLFGIDRRTVDKMLRFSVPPGYRRSKPAVRPKLDPFIAVIDRILKEDNERPKKQRHTSKRIFERLRDERGYTGGITIVKVVCLLPIVTGMIFCSVIAACQQYQILRRASEWTEALASWCARQPEMIAFTGRCLNYEEWQRDG